MCKNGLCTPVKTDLVLGVLDVFGGGYYVAGTQAIRHKASNYWSIGSHICLRPIRCLVKEP